MKSFNEVKLLGNMGKDADVRYTASGVALANFSIATTKSKKLPNGEYDNKTTWHNIVAWRDQAEACASLEKGDLVFVAGEIQQETWDDAKTGQKRYAVKINAYTVFKCVKPEKADVNVPVPGPRSTDEDDDITF